MNGAFYIGATGLRSQQTALDVVANNIANINTPAFKRSQVRFSELVSPRAIQSDLTPGGPDVATMMSGVMAKGSAKVFTQGDLRQTGKPLDLAIDGEGFIELVGQDGQSLLWRGGELKVGEDGYLAASNGMPLKAMISVPLNATGLIVGRDGKVSTTSGDGAAPVEIGRIDIVLARDVDNLEAQADGLYLAPNNADLLTAAPGEDSAGVLVQGSVEASNVELSDEMVSLLVMQRAYAANAQVLQAGDQLMSIANSLRR